MLSKNQVMIAAHYNITIGNVEKLVSNVADKENYVLHFESLQLFRITSEKNYRVIELNKSHWLIQYIKFKTEKIIETEKNGDKDGKAFYGLGNIAVYTKTTENVRSRIDVKLIINKKGKAPKNTLYNTKSI